MEMSEKSLSNQYLSFNDDQCFCGCHTRGKCCSCRKSKWIKCTPETMPWHSRDVIFWLPDIKSAKFGYVYDEQIFINGLHSPNVKVSHWMEITDPTEE